VYRVQGLRGGFHVLFVEFEDFVVACEAPTSWLELDEMPASDVVPGATSASLSATYLSLIRETIPDKPVRYVVLTHGHGDHAGGVREFVAAGATVLAGAAVRPLVERAVAEAHTIHPDALALAPRPLRFEAVTSPRTITDGTQRLELLPVEPNPHAEGLLAVHLPDLNALYVADVFQPFNLQRGPPPAERPLMRVFVDWLDRTGLAPDMVFTAHGGGVATAEHLAAVRSGGATR
jgi:glyoxylase-like metal-dependent hydrolase (beta-lactamase superfamily II)